MNLQDLNNLLDSISQSNSRDIELKKLVENCGSLELKWILRIILKKLSIGIHKIWDIYHPNAEQFYSENSNIRAVCDTFQDKNVIVEKSVSKLSVLHPFKPMLLERICIEKARELFYNNNDGIIVQTKFDGERSQLHMKNGKFKYFTRHGFDITNNSSYGESENSPGFLTGRIIRLLNPNCRSIILDGELMGWHKQKNIFSTKGLLFDVKKLTENSSLQPCFVAYDIVHYNDECLLDKPFKERTKILEEAFQDCQGILIKCKNIHVTNFNELKDIFNEALDKNEEGIVLRDPNGIYKLNTRAKSGCYKVKAEFSSDLAKDIDLAVVGAYYSEKKTVGLFGSFLLAVVDDSNKNNNKYKYYTIVSIKSGLKDIEKQNMVTHLRPYWIKKKPTNVEGPTKYPPDFWIEPENSIVLQINATEMITCDHQPSKYTFRFPRVKKVRYDKPCNESCTLDELKSFINVEGYIQKLNKNRVIFDNRELKSKEKKIRETTSMKRVNINFQGVRTCDIIKLTRLFENKEFCVTNEKRDSWKNNKLTKSDIEKIILQHSGKIVQTPTVNKTFCIIARDDKEVRTKSYIDSELYDVVKVDWLMRVTKKENWKYVKDFKPWECFTRQKSTIQRHLKKYDIYNDSFTKKIDINILNKLLNNITILKNHHDIDPTNSILQNVQTEFPQDAHKRLSSKLFGSVSQYTLFINIFGYFTDPNDAKKYLFIFTKGNCCDEINNNVTHIFVSDKSINIDELSMQIDESLTKIIDSQWINDCFDQKKLLPEESYLLTANTN